MYVLVRISTKMKCYGRTFLKIDTLIANQKLLEFN